MVILRDRHTGCSWCPQSEIVGLNVPSHVPWACRGQGTPPGPVRSCFPDLPGIPSWWDATGIYGRRPLVAGKIEHVDRARVGLIAIVQWGARRQDVTGDSR